MGEPLKDKVESLKYFYEWCKEVSEEDWNKNYNSKVLAKQSDIKSAVEYFKSQIKFIHVWEDGRWVVRQDAIFNQLKKAFPDLQLPHNKGNSKED